MAEAHIEGFYFLLRDGGILLDDAESPNFAELPRTVGYADPGASERGTLEGSADGVVITVQTTCIGITREQAGAELDKVRELVEGKRPSVIGWSCTRIENLFSNLPRRDDDVDPAVFYAVATWRFTAVPA
jgi:hypothetical protein